MAINAWPLDAVTGSPSYTGRMLRQLTGAMWARNPSVGRPLGTPGGVISNVNSVPFSVQAGGANYIVGAHLGVIDAEGASAGPYVYVVDSTVTSAVAAVSSGQYRYDLVSIQISDPAEADGTSTPGAAIIYTQGTPNAVLGSATVPATPARSMALGSILVPPTGSPTLNTVQWIPASVHGGMVLRTGSALPSAGLYVPGTLMYDGYLTADAGLKIKDDTTGSWVPLVQKGTVSYSIASGAQTATATITFPLAYSGSKLPKVMATVTAAQPHSAQITASGSTTFTYRVFRTPGTNASSTEAGTFDWVAIL